MTTSTNTTTATIIQLQNPHEILSPSQRFKVLSELCENENINEWDVYGDFMSSYQTKNDDDASSSSFLRKFESQIAKEFGKDDAVFMPSGVMAQSIALLIHNNNNNNNNNKQRQNVDDFHRNKFACHVTSHLLLHEQHGYKELCGLDAVILSTTGTTSTAKPTSTTGFFGQSPLLHQHLIEADDLDGVSTVILELPHRELGGKLTPYEDIVQMNQYLKSNGIAFHCDGARIFEAAAGYGESVLELASLFDSVYISFYKGLGGLSGAMLMGDKDFCDEARIWLRRFGGNLYTFMPYVVSAWSGYQNNYIIPKYSSTNDSSSCMSFEEKKDKLVRLSKIFAADASIQQVLTLEPTIPQVNMVHCYVRPSEDICKKVCNDVQDRKGICIFQRIRPLSRDDPGFKEGFSCKLEISIGEANGRIPDNVWVEAWKEFCSECLKEMI